MTLFRSRMSDFSDLLLSNLNLQKKWTALTMTIDSTNILNEMCVDRCNQRTFITGKISTVNFSGIKNYIALRRNSSNVDTIYSRRENNKLYKEIKPIKSSWKFIRVIFERGAIIYSNDYTFDGKIDAKKQNMNNEIKQELGYKFPF